MSLPSRVVSILELLVRAGDPLEKLSVLRIPTKAPYPEEVRLALSKGSRKAVDRITADEVVGIQQALLENSGDVTKNPIVMYLPHAGHLMEAPDVVKVLKDDSEFVGKFTKKLFEYSAGLGGTVLNINSRLLGDNKLSGISAGVKATVNERAMRLTKAVLIMVTELETLGLDPALLLEERFLAQAVEFTRGFVTRYGTSAGLRFEFRQAAELDQVLRPLLTGLDFQRYIPKLAEKIVGKGPDAFAYLRDLAFAMQFKSSLNPARLLGGCAKPVRHRKIITDVSGSEVARQTLSDLIRLAMWEYRVPLPGVDWRSVSPPPIVDSQALAPLRIVVIDDTRFVDLIFAELSWAIREGKMYIQGGTNVLDIGALRRPFQATVVRLLQPVVGTSRVIPLDDVAGLRVVAQSQVSQAVAELETGLNERLAPVISSTLGGLAHEVKVVTASEAPSRIPALLGVTPPTPPTPPPPTPLRPLGTSP